MGFELLLDKVFYGLDVMVGGGFDGFYALGICQRKLRQESLEKGLTICRNGGQCLHLGVGRQLL